MDTTTTPISSQNRHDISSPWFSLSTCKQPLTMLIFRNLFNPYVLASLTKYFSPHVTSSKSATSRIQVSSPTLQPFLPESNKGTTNGTASSTTSPSSPVSFFVSYTLSPSNGTSLSTNIGGVPPFSVTPIPPFFTSIRVSQFIPATSSTPSSSAQSSTGGDSVTNPASSSSQSASAASSTKAQTLSHPTASHSAEVNIPAWTSSSDTGDPTPTTSIPSVSSPSDALTASAWMTSEISTSPTASHHLFSRDTISHRSGHLK